MTSSRRPGRRAGRGPAFRRGGRRGGGRSQLDAVRRSRADRLG